MIKIYILWVLLSGTWTMTWGTFLQESPDSLHLMFILASGKENPISFPLNEEDCFELRDTLYIASDGITTIMCLPKGVKPNGKFK